MDQQWLCLQWTSLQWIDIFDRNMFRHPPNENHILSHDLVHASTGEILSAKFTLERHHRTVRLHYDKLKEVADWNLDRNRDFEAGTLVLHFKDDNFQFLDKNVEWRYPGRRDRKSSPCKEVSLSTIGGSHYDGAVGTKKRHVGTVVQRDSKFRRSVMGAYGGRCAITGCPIPQVLQAAHIFPYAGRASDVVSNSVLLRRDLHALFDSFQMGIDPDTLVPKFSPSIMNLGYREYLRLAKSGRPMSIPTQTFYQPNRALLKKHWNRFEKEV
jgi:HNH endonuclease